MDKQENILYIPHHDDGVRLDKWLMARFPTISYTVWAKFCRKGNVRLDGKRVTGAERVKEGQAVRVPPPEVLEKNMVSTEAIKLKPLSAPFKAEVESWIIYEDEDLLCLNKPSGLAVQGGTKTQKHVDGLLSRWALEKKITPKLVHRIDRDTSGLLLVAKTDKAARELGHSFKTHQIEKYYVAVTVGVPMPLMGTINAPLEKGVKDNKEKMIVSPKGLRAVTHYRVLDKIGKKMAVVGLSPVSGRTHQLRVHLQHISTPILGDLKYGEGTPPEFSLSATLHLHATMMKVPRPGKKDLFLEADLPLHFKQTFQELGFSSHDILKQLKGFVNSQ